MERQEARALHLFYRESQLIQACEYELKHNKGRKLNSFQHKHAIACDSVLLIGIMLQVWCF